MTTHTQAEIEALADRMRKEALARSNYTGYFDEKLTQDMMVSAGLLYALAAAARAPGDGHASDCATHNMPASPNGPCDCGALAATDGAEAFQARVRPWMLACFNETIMADVVERCDRFIEEALELCQANGWPAERAHALVDYVYGRDQGDINQEVGGVMVTLAALCLAIGVDMHEAGETELARVWTKIDKIRAKQASKPTGSALPIAAPPAPEVKAEAVTKAAYDAQILRADQKHEWALREAALAVNLEAENARLRKIISAAPPPPEVKAEARLVAVKPLEWRVPDDHPRDPDPDGCIWAANGLGGVYAVSRKQSVGEPYLLWWAHDPMDWSGFASIEDAQAAAQADYESRIRSALIEAPAAPSQEMSAAEMRDAAAKVSERLERDDAYILGDGPTIAAAIRAHPLTSEPSVS